VTGTDLLRDAIARLKQNGVPDPARDARLLLAEALNLETGRLTLVLGESVDPEARQKFRDFIDRRARREPVSHLLGRRAFYGREFRVSRDVLDPRPETETLIATALELDWTSVLDLGTGSGAILLTLLAERPEATGMGTDLSGSALQVARQNSEALALSDRSSFLRADWGTALTGHFNLVVSNPPYISAKDYETLEPEPHLFEPREALSPGLDGLEAYRAIAVELPRLMARGGHALFEIGPDQAGDVGTILKHAGLGGIRVLDDLDGRNRVVLARNGT